MFAAPLPLLRKDVIEVCLSTGDALLSPPAKEASSVRDGDEGGVYCIFVLSLIGELRDWNSAYHTPDMIHSPR